MPPGARLARIAAFTALSIVGLAAALVILFAIQGAVLVARSLAIALLAVPILTQSYGISALACGAV